jgi:hypothetical protein
MFSFGSLFRFLNPDFSPNAVLPLGAKKKREVLRTSRILDFKHENICLLGRDTILLSRRDQLMKPEFKNHNILTTISPRDRHDARSLCELTRCADNDPLFPPYPKRFVILSELSQELHKRALAIEYCVLDRICAMLHLFRFLLRSAYRRNYSGSGTDVCTRGYWEFRCTCN